MLITEADMRIPDFVIEAIERGRALHPENSEAAAYSIVDDANKNRDLEKWLMLYAAEISMADILVDLRDGFTAEKPISVVEAFTYAQLAKAKNNPEELRNLISMRVRSMIETKQSHERNDEFN